MSWREEFNRITQGRTFYLRLDDPSSFVTIVETIAFDMHEAGQRSNRCLVTEHCMAEKIQKLESEKAALERELGAWRGIAETREKGRDAYYADNLSLKQEIAELKEKLRHSLLREYGYSRYNPDTETQEKDDLPVVEVEDLGCFVRLRVDGRLPLEGGCAIESETRDGVVRRLMDKILIAGPVKLVLKKD